jgi:hypothetical protein
MLSMGKSMGQSVLDLQAQHQRLKNDQSGKGSQILIFKFQVGIFMGSTHDFVLLYFTEGGLLQGVF